MKSTLLLAFSILIFSNLFSQDETLHIYHHNRSDQNDCQDENYILWGDNYYLPNMRGLNSLMLDLYVAEPELYEELRPEFEELKRRNANANTVLGLGASVGTILVFAPFVDFMKNSGTDYSYSSWEDENEFNFGPLIGGVVVTSLAAIIYGSMNVRRQDLFDFTNRFNQNSEGEKLQWKFRPAFGLNHGGSASFGLCLEF